MQTISDFHLAFIVLILLLIYVRHTVRCYECPYANVSGVTWPPTAAADANDAVLRHASTPWCLDDRLYLQTRQCVDDGRWLPAEAPVCAAHQQPADVAGAQCPTGMDQLRAGSSALLLSPLCAQLHVAGVWSLNAAQCARLGTERTVLRLDGSEMRLVTEYVQRLWKGEYVGLPAEWIEPNRLRWQLAGQTGGLVEELSALTVGQAVWPGNGCAAMRMPAEEELVAGNVNTDWSRLLVKRSCDDLMPMLCVYAEPSPLLRLACPEGRQTLRYAQPNQPQAQCYAVETPRAADSMSQTLFKMTDARQTALGQQLRDATATGERCTFDGIGDQERRFSNVSSADWLAAADAASAIGPTPYVNWDVQFDFEASGIIGYVGVYTTVNEYLVCDREGRWSMADDFACVMVADDLSAVGAPTLELRLMGANATDYIELLLQLRHPAELWRTAGQDEAGDGSGGGVTCFRSDVRHQHIETVSIGVATALTNDTISYAIPLADDGSAAGLYWCEAYTVPPGMERITSGQRPVSVDRPDRIVATVWRQVRFANATVDLVEWLRNALRDADQSATVRMDAVTVRSVRAERRDGGDFLRIVFGASVTFITGEPFEPADQMLQFTDLPILRVAAKVDRVLRALRVPPFHYPVVNSTEFCLPEVRSTSNWTLWPGGRLGEQHTGTEICWVSSDGQPAVRRCVGNAADGAMWLDVTRAPCLPNVTVTPLTLQLHEAAVSFRTQAQTGDRMGEVQRLVASVGGGGGSDGLRAFDVISIGNIMDRAAQLNSEHALQASVVNDMLDIYDGLMAVDAALTRLAASVNSTNLLLAALDSMLGNASPGTEVADEWPTSRQPTERRGQHLQVHWLDPRATNVSGVALYGDGRVRYLFANQSAAEMLAERALLVAAFLPEALLAALPPLSKVVVGVCDSEVLFQAGDQAKPSDHRLLSRHIISISIPNVDTAALPLPVAIFFGHDATAVDATAADAAGTYWPLDNRRSWTASGVQLVANSTYVVQFSATHLTNFAYIVRDKLQFSVQDGAALFVITVAGSALSLTGIVGIFLTALRFATWRSKASNQLLLQLSAAIAGMLLLFLFADNREALANRTVCITMGAVLHYMVLVTFMWMLVMAYLQFMRYVVVFVQMRSERYVLKLSCVGWLVPMVPVAIVLAIDPNLYLPADAAAAAADGDEGADGTDGTMCYPTGLALYGGLLAPIGLIIVCNVFVFVSVIYNLLQVQSANRSIVLAQLRVSSFLFFLLGLTWIFGFFSRGDGPSLLFAYLFCATATLQGLVLFVYFVLLEPVTRQMWTNDMRTVCGMRRRGSMSVVVNS